MTIESYQKAFTIFAIGWEFQYLKAANYLIQNLKSWQPKTKGKSKCCHKYTHHFSRC